MTNETMTIHEALRELKTLDSRIRKAIIECQYVGTTKGLTKKVGSATIEEFCADARSRYLQLQDLIRRRNAIKRSVVLSNATTKIQVAGVEYTVAEAIEMKNHGIEFKRDLMNRMSYKLSDANEEIRRFNSELEAKADLYVQQVVGAKEKATSAEAMKLREDYIKVQTMELVDPLGAAAEIEVMQNDIDLFETKVDAALSVSNATTIIEIAY